MRGKKVIFHAGAHKTGTSLLQKFMRDKKDLLRQYGLYYLSRSAMNDYVGWGQNLIDHPRRLRLRIEYTMANPRYRFFITSHENTLGRPLRPKKPNLYPDSDPMIEALARLLKPFDSQIIFYIRSQDEFLESYYLQRIHEGRSLPFEQWLAQFDLDAVSWRPTIEHLRDAVGSNRLQVVDFNTIRRGQDVFIRDFFERIDPRLTIPVEYKPIRNPSISEKGLQMALAVNPHLKKSQRKPMRKFLQKYFSNVDYPRPALLTDEQKTSLRERYGSENRALLTTSVAAAGSPASDR